MGQRPFRFGLQAFEGTTATEWFETARKTEDLGYSTLYSSDHYFGPGPISEVTGHRPVELAPLTSIAMAAARTTTLRVGCRVFCCDFHHPVVLAKEMATLDLLSEGRLDVGLGAGWIGDEYDGLGVPMDSAGTRIARLAHVVEVLRAHWSGDLLDVHNDSFDVGGFAGLPVPVQQPGPPIMIGGGGRKVLQLAGRVADIVSINFNNASGRLNSASVMSSGAGETADKLAWIHEGAGDRFDDVEIELGAYFVAVGEQAAGRLDTMAGRFGVDPDGFGAHPHALFGSVEQICDTLQERRERFGVSFVTVAQRHLDEFAPVVAALAGR